MKATLRKYNYINITMSHLQASNSLTLDITSLILFIRYLSSNTIQANYYHQNCPSKLHNGVTHVHSILFDASEEYFYQLLFPRVSSAVPDKVILTDKAYCSCEFMFDRSFCVMVFNVICYVFTIFIVKGNCFPDRFSSIYGI